MLGETALNELALGKTALNEVVLGETALKETELSEPSLDVPQQLWRALQLVLSIQ